MNSKVRVFVKTLPHFEGSLPRYETLLSSGLDVRACLKENLTLKPQERALIPTGLAFEIPQGYEVQARPRSGWAFRDGLSLLNSPGTIDADYRGEIKILLINLGEKTVTIKNQHRVAQLVLCPVAQAKFQLVEHLSETKRGQGGFGSTGKGNKDGASISGG